MKEDELKERNVNVLLFALAQFPEGECDMEIENFNKYQRRVSIASKLDPNFRIIFLVDKIDLDKGAMN